MKKWIIGILMFLAVFFVFIYIRVPSRAKIVNVALIKSNANAVQRTVSRQDLWDKWAPGEFKITEKLTNGININSILNGQTIPGQIIVVSLRDDSCAIRWESTLLPSKGPLDRLCSYVQARKLKRKTNQEIERFRNFCNMDSNIYGFNIQQISTRDTFLVATRFLLKHYPSVEEIYNNINKLRKFVAENNLAQTNSPMLSITTEDSIDYRCMVAVPINQMVEGKGDIFFVRMVPGHFLATELKGGPSAIRHAHESMRLYFRDYKKTSMAIPFEYLVTDRLSEKDTAKWLTRLYYPAY